MRDAYDFFNAKRTHEVPHLSKLQAEHGKTRITIMLDDDVLAAFRERAAPDWVFTQSVTFCAENYGRHVRNAKGRSYKPRPAKRIRACHPWRWIPASRRV
jgi:hypothetical protein